MASIPRLVSPTNLEFPMRNRARSEFAGKERNSSSERLFCEVEEERRARPRRSFVRSAALLKAKREALFKAKAVDGWAPMVVALPSGGKILAVESTMEVVEAAVVGESE